MFFLLGSAPQRSGLLASRAPLNLPKCSVNTAITTHTTPKRARGPRTLSLDSGGSFLVTTSSSSNPLLPEYPERAKSIDRCVRASEKIFHRFVHDRSAQDWNVRLLPNRNRFPTKTLMIDRYLPARAPRSVYFTHLRPFCEAALPKAEEIKLSLRLRNTHRDEN